MESPLYIVADFKNIYYSVYINYHHILACVYCAGTKFDSVIQFESVWMTIKFLVISTRGHADQPTEYLPLYFAPFLLQIASKPCTFGMNMKP